MKSKFITYFNEISHFVNAHRDAKIAANIGAQQTFEYLGSHEEDIGLWMCIFCRHLPRSAEIHNSCPPAIFELAQEYSFKMSNFGITLPNYLKSVK